MKIFVFAGLSLVSFPVLADVMLEGTYKGVAEWKTPDGVGSQYEVSTTIRSNRVTSSYNYSAGQTITWDFVANFKDNDFFDMMIDDQKVGEGYCFGLQCHYSSFDGNLEETFTFVGDNLYKMGSKKIDGNIFVWREMLNKL